MHPIPPLVLQSQVGELLRVSDGAMVVGEHRSLIGRMWEDGGVQECYARRNEFQISDSAKQSVCCEYVSVCDEVSFALAI